MDGGCLCCVDGQEEEVAVCQSPALFFLTSVKVLGLLLADCWVLVPAQKFCQLQEKWLYVSIWFVLTSAAGTQINMFFLCVSEGGFLLASRRRHADTWLHWHASRYCWCFKCLVKWGPVAWSTQWLQEVNWSQPRNRSSPNPSCCLSVQLFFRFNKEYKHMDLSHGRS